MKEVRKLSISAGPPVLKLYSVVDLKFCVQPIPGSNITEILVEFFLSKPLMGNLLTQFLPTALLLIIRKKKIDFLTLYKHLIFNLAKLSTYFLKTISTWWLRST